MSNSERLFPIGILEKSKNNELDQNFERGEFYLAENYHHNYFSENEEAPYCSTVIAPKLQKFKKKPQYC